MSGGTRGRPSWSSRPTSTASSCTASTCCGGDHDDRLTEFTVMVRPFKGLTTLMEQMAAALTQSSD